MAASKLTAFETEPADEFEDVALLLDSDPEQQSSRKHPSRKDKFLNYFTRVNSRSQAGFEKLDQSDDVQSISQRIQGRWSPEEEAGVWSRLFFSFCSGLIRMGKQKALNPEDLWDLPYSDEAATVSQAFEAELTKSVNLVAAPQGTVWKAMWRKHGRVFLAAGLLKLVHDCVMFLGPFVLQQLLIFLEKGGSAWVGSGLAVALGASNTLETLTVNQYFHMLYRVALHLKISLVDMLYQKSLRITAASKGKMGVGAIVNLQSNDASKLWSMAQYLHIIWSGPFQILVVMGLLMRIIHVVPALAGLSVTIVLVPITTVVSRRLSKVRRALIKCTDDRVKLVTEVITGIKAIKLYAWEQPYIDRINQLREAELKMIRKAAFYQIFNTIMFGGGPILVSLASFGAFTFQGYSLTASIAFPALALFNLLRFPVMMFPNQIMNIIAAKVALDRIQNYMQEEELQHPEVTPAAAPGSPAVLINNGSFAWEAGGVPLLRHLSLEVPAGHLLIVIGEVGAGKSSLLAALLGEMYNEGGTMSVAGSTGFAAQDPWIQNATLRDNILMGSPLNEDRYQKVLAACALQADLDMLPAGDQSEIGEKGINLSGGQRARVALARACYADADVYLLDDPLSAVDAHVGRHLFDSCMCDLLAGKTRILVTHQLHYLAAADLVAVVKGGSISDIGSYDELVSRGVDFHEFQLGDTASEHSVAPALNDHQDEVLLESRRSSHFEASSSSSPLPAGGREHVHQARPADCNSGLMAVEATLEHAVEAGMDASMAVLDAGVGAGETAIESLLSTNPDPDHVTHAHAGEAPTPRAGTNNSPTPSIDSDKENNVEMVNLLHHPNTSGGVGPRTPGGSKQQRDDTFVDVADGEVQQSEQPLLKEEQKKSSVEGGASKDAGVLVRAEERAVGRVDRRLYRAYLAAWGPFFAIPMAMVTMALSERGLQVGQNWWLSVWSNTTTRLEKEGLHLNSSKYMTIYFTLGLVSLWVQGGRALLLVLGSFNASRRLHANLLAKVMRLPMAFFDSQPTGRLLNRFTKDTESVDTSVSYSVQSFMTCSISVFGAILVVTAVTPTIVLAIALLGIVYYRVQVYYIATSRELKRLDSLALSPIFGNFNESLQGLLTLRAFRKQEQFTARNHALLDNSNRCWWPIQVVNRWLSVRLEMLGICIVFGAALFVAVLLPRNAGLAGLALTSALNLTGLMNWMVRQSTELEVNMNAVERVIEYTKLTPEKPPVIASHRPPQGWPSQGVVEAQDLVVRYREDLDPVLKHINFKTQPHEKIGVVGRTGGGKSTLMTSLYRIVEPCGGRIIIDDIDVSQLGLTDLRSRLALVPQDPVVFSGSVRANLDPFDAVGGDVYIWEALEQAGMADTFRHMAGGLDAEISEGGGNLSTGQRQLLCMARALLRRTKILVLDEATSNVDSSTDQLIQSTIRTAFKDCTVLTIAHRLNTIIDSDRIMVLDAGQLVEFDTPATLLKNPESIFSGLVAEASRDTKDSASSITSKV